MTDRDWTDAPLVNAARDIDADDPAFGYRYIADELPGKGITAGEKRVQRLCRDNGIWSVFSKKRGARTADPGRRSKMTWSSGISPPPQRASPTSAR